MCVMAVCVLRSGLGHLGQQRKELEHIEKQITELTSKHRLAESRHKISLTVLTSMKQGVGHLLHKLKDMYEQSGAPSFEVPEVTNATVVAVRV
jgi:hypothetical protein